MIKACCQTVQIKIKCFNLLSLSNYGPIECEPASVWWYPAHQNQFVVKGKHFHGLNWPNIDNGSYNTYVFRIQIQVSNYEFSMVHIVL